MSLKYGELFAGYGGLGMGVQSVLGGEMAWCAEFDKAPSAILAHHWPDVPNLGDITKVDWSTVEPVDVLTGGFPCQDVSHAGRRAGLIRDGEGRTRSGLWGEMLRAVVETKPRLVVAENVRGLLSARADSDMEQCPFCMGDGGGSPMRALGAVLGDLADIGFDAWWYGLRAADVGAAHGRFRVFIFATPADAERGGWDGWAREQVGRPLARAAAAGCGEEASGGLTLLPTPAVNDMGASYTPETWDEWTAKMKSEHGNGNGHGKSLSIEAQRLLPTPASRDYKDHRVEVAAHRPNDADNLNRAIAHLLPTPVADNSRGLPSSGTDYASLANSVAALLPTPQTAYTGTSVEAWRERRPAGNGATRETVGDLRLVTEEMPDRWGDYAAAIARWEHVIGRPAPDPTEPGKTGNPRLSPAFVEWLMGLPAGHVTDPAIGISRNDQLKALGNGVVPQQAAAATRAFIADMTKAVAE